MVLIETLWNVNRGQVIATPVENIVLIETLWNVNRKSLLVSFLVRQRINRNIVECKLVHKTTAIIVCNVLIETLWNVNELVKHDICCTTLRINRNIVECKFATTSFNNSIVFCINRNIVECK